MINFHFHDERSSDGVGPLDLHCQAAAAGGVAHLCVTNHAEVMSPNGEWTADLEEMRNRFLAVAESVAECRDRFPGLDIRLGIELEYRREWTATFDRLTSDVSFDFVLGSVHLVDGFNVSGGPDRNRFFDGRPQDLAYARYFEEVAEMVEWGGFDAVAHFDLVKRFGHEHYGGYDVRDFEAIVRPVLDRMAGKAIGIEINTSGVSGPGTPYPDVRILEWAREAGVPALTIGTDSHRPEAFGQGLVEGIALARAAGWDSFSIYEDRQPVTRVSLDLAEAWVRSGMSPG